MLSGKTGQTLLTFGDTASFGQFGASVAGPGAAKGDGVTDLAAGAPAADGKAGSEAGAVWLVSPECPDVPSVGTGCPGVGGSVPQITLEGCAVGGAEVTLALAGPSGGFALLLVGTAPGPTPIGPNCQAEMALPAPLAIGPLPLGGTGTLALPAPLPVPMPPVALHIQAFVFDPLAPGAFSATPALVLAPL